MEECRAARVEIGSAAFDFSGKCSVSPDTGTNGVSEVLLNLIDICRGSSLSSATSSPREAPGAYEGMCTLSRSQSIVSEDLSTLPPEQPEWLAKLTARSQRSARCRPGRSPSRPAARRNSSLGLGLGRTSGTAPATGALRGFCPSPSRLRTSASVMDFTTSAGASAPSPFPTTPTPAPSGGLRTPQSVPALRSSSSGAKGGPQRASKLGSLGPLGLGSLGLGFGLELDLDVGVCSPEPSPRACGPMGHSLHPEALFDRFGSYEGLSAAVDDLHRRLECDPRLGPVLLLLQHVPPQDVRGVVMQLMALCLEEAGTGTHHNHHNHQQQQVHPCGVWLQHCRGLFREHVARSGGGGGADALGAIDARAYDAVMGHVADTLRAMGLQAYA